MACVVRAWQESVNTNLSQDTEKIIFSSAAFQLIITEVFQNSKHKAATQGEMNPSGVKGETSCKKSRWSVLRNAA